MMMMVNVYDYYYYGYIETDTLVAYRLQRYSSSFMMMKRRKFHERNFRFYAWLNARKRISFKTLKTKIISGILYGSKPFRNDGLLFIKYQLFVA